MVNMMNGRPMEVDPSVSTWTLGLAAATFS
jgi:hypothetical protein